METGNISRRLEELGPVSAEAARSYSRAFSRIRSVVEEKLAIDLPGDDEFVRSSSEHFGRSLEAVYAYSLWRALVLETAGLAAGLSSRGMSGRLSYLLRVWVLAVSSSVKPPELYELTGPLEILREHAGELEEAAVSMDADRPSCHSAFIEHILGGRIDDAAGEARSSLDRLGSVDSVLESVFYPALAEVGGRWRENSIGIAEEHAATAALRAAAHRFFDSVPSRKGHSMEVAVACVPGDEHDIGAEILALYLESAGWPVYFIGHSTPEAEMIREIERGGYGAVLLSVSMVRHLPSLERLAATIRERRPGIRIVSGGGALSLGAGVMDRVADATAATPADADRVLTEMEGG